MSIITVKILILPSKWKKWLVVWLPALLGCWAMTASPLPLATFPFGSTSVLSFRDILQVGHDVSCSNQDLRQELGTRKEQQIT